ncbi:hypothetical protein ACFWIO_09485 [Streptomyces diastatochromogenes]|uniref:DUF7848 domain-containing protein n=1 Tax=Streptomyces diastatochromogenes TaxID=42236 RepID=UPI0036466A55
MPARSVWRFVNYTINHVSEDGVTWEIFCSTYGCEGSHIADSDEQCSDWAMRHTAKTGHALFRRSCSDHARVTRG